MYNEKDFVKLTRVHTLCKETSSVETRTTCTKYVHLFVNLMIKIIQVVGFLVDCLCYNYVEHKIIIHGQQQQQSVCAGTVIRSFRICPKILSRQVLLSKWMLCRVNSIIFCNFMAICLSVCVFVIKL